jgi:hypothetical protein
MSPPSPVKPLSTFNTSSDKTRDSSQIMECKRCGGTDHPNARWLLCPENIIAKKIISWDGSQLADCTITDSVIAGFIDADGSLKTDSAGYLRFNLSQSHQFGLDLLDLISLYLDAGRITGPYRNYEFSLRINGTKAADVAMLMDTYCVVKGRGDLSDEWLGGFFAGDGCVSRMSSRCPRVSIGQKDCPEILEAIQQYLGYGSVSKNSREWYCYADNARNFARRFANFALHKRSDLLAILL